MAIKGYSILPRSLELESYPTLKNKVGNRNRGRSEGSLFNSYYTEVSGRALLLSLDCSTLLLIRTLYCWELSKVVSSTIFKVFGMTRTGIEPRSSGPLANTRPTGPMSRVLKLATVVKGDMKAPFLIATTPRCRGGSYSFPWIPPLYAWSLPYNAEY